MKLKLFLAVLPLLFLFSCQLPTDVAVEELNTDQEVISRSVCYDGGVFKIQAPYVKFLAFCMDGTWEQVNSVSGQWVPFGNLSGTWNLSGTTLILTGLYNYTNFSEVQGGYELDGPVFKLLIFIE